MCKNGQSGGSQAVEWFMSIEIMKQVLGKLLNLYRMRIGFFYVEGFPIGNNDRTIAYLV